MQHFGGGAQVTWSVTVRHGLPIPALSTYTIYFPVLPPTSARGLPQTCSGSRSPADRVLSLRLCRVYSSCLPLRWLDAFTTCDATDGEPAGAAGCKDVSPRGSHSWQLHAQGLDDAESGSFARAMVGEFPGWEASSAPRHRSRLLCPACTAATAMGLGCSFTTFSSRNSATPWKGNLSNFLIIILWNAKKLQQ